MLRDVGERKIFLEIKVIIACGVCVCLLDTFIYFIPLEVVRIFQ